MLFFFFTGEVNAQKWWFPYHRGQQGHNPAGEKESCQAARYRYEQFFWIYPHVMSLILMLWQRHMLILKLYCWTISIIRAVALNLVHLMNQPEYALWCTCMCVTFMELSQLWGNGSCNCWFKLIYIHIIIHPIMRGFLKTFSKWCFIYCSRLNSSSTTWCCWVYRARDLLEWNWLLLGEQGGLGGFHQFENKQPSLCWFPPS